MEKIAIVTDSNSGITQEEGRRLEFPFCQCLFILMMSCILKELRSHRKSFMRNSRMMRRFLLHSQARQRCAVCGTIFEGV